MGFEWTALRANITACCGWMVYKQYQRIEMSVKWRHIVSIVQCGYRLQYTALLDFKAMHQIGILKIIQMRVRMLVRCTMYILASAYVYVYIFASSKAQSHILFGLHWNNYERSEGEMHSRIINKVNTTKTITTYAAHIWAFSHTDRTLLRTNSLSILWQIKRPSTF